MIELLVVIAVIGMSAALLLPAIQSSRESARRAQCKNNLRQLALAVHNFHDAESSVPPMDLGNRWATWAVLLLPYIDAGSQFSNWDLRKPYSAQPTTAGGDLVVLHCPSQWRRPKSNGDLFPFPPFTLGPAGWGDFAGVWGSATAAKDGAFIRAMDSVTNQEIMTPAVPTLNTLINPWWSKIRFTDMAVDGLSLTLLFGEKYLPNPDADRSIFSGMDQSSYVRVCGRGRTIVNPASDYIVSGDWRFGSQHTGFCHFAFADGHVAPISVHTDESIQERLAIVGDGAVVEGF